MSEKILWVVNYDNLATFLAKAREVGAAGVAIRTDNDVRAAITQAHAFHLKVYGWRWPSALRDPAMNEAAKVKALFDQGMDGYYVDPEPNERAALNWDQRGMEGLATDFCKAVAAAAKGRPFGFTSHYLAKRVAPNLPWATFFQYATVLLPQSYWRSTAGVIGHGIPQDNYAVAIDAWTKAGGDPQRIVPMAGELGVSTAAQIKAYAAAAAQHGIGQLHFYAYDDDVSASVWAAVGAA